MNDGSEIANRPVVQGDLALMGMQMATALTYVRLALMHLHARRTDEFASALDEIGHLAESLSENARHVMASSISAQDG